MICAVLALFIGLGIFLLWQREQERQPEIPKAQQIGNEELAEEETEEVVFSMEQQSAFEYVMVEEDGYLVVYEKDMQTVFLETHIPLYRLTEELREEIAIGKKFENVEAVYDFLENYSS